MKYKQNGVVYNAEDLTLLAQAHYNYMLIGRYTGDHTPVGPGVDHGAIQLAVRNSMDAGLTSDDLIAFDKISHGK